MKVDFNIIKDTSNKTKVIIFGIITVLVSLIGLTYSWVANWLVGSSSDMSLTSAMLHLNYRGTSPTILAYLAPGETVEKNFEITNYNSASATYNLSWVSVQNLFNPTSEIIYTVSERTLGEIVSARTAPSSDVNIARNISIGPGETQYLTLTLTFVLDEERDQTNNIGNYFVGDISMDQNPQIDLNYTEVYQNDILVNQIPDVTTFKFDDKRSWCTDGTIIDFNIETSTFIYTNFTYTTSCKAYFYTSKDFAYIAPTVSVPNPYTEYTTPYEGWYQIEAWGAEGGKNMVDNDYTSLYSILGGKGGYTSGQIHLNENDTIYVYVGGKGLNGASGQIVSGGYNGGGQGDYDHVDDEAAGAGGGSTDIRLSASTNTTNSRIMVAGGGGGSAYDGIGGYGGGLIGGATVYSTGGTQIDGYSFALGQPGTFVNTNVDVGGGGGGYYGGNANSSGAANTYQTSGAGGSSFISGHTGCVAIASSDLTNNPRTTRTGIGGVSCETGTTENSCSIHYSNKYFRDTKMIDGLGYLWTYQRGIQEKMPNPNGGYYDLGVGHSGDGYARIKYIPNFASHTISFDLAGGIQSKDYNDEYYEGYNYFIETPIKIGYTFMGWTIDGIGSKINDNILTVGVANATLTANWEINTYTITYNLVDDSIINPITYTVHTASFTLNNPNEEGFFGWTGSNGNIPQLTVIVPQGSSGDKVYTANWIPIVADFDFVLPSGAQQTFLVPVRGKYKIELWGAQGGSSLASAPGGKGAYTYGEIFLEKDALLYIYVGNSPALNENPFNGGGLANNSYYPTYDGGGATDIRYGGATINDRIMVAGAGGGYEAYSSGVAGGAAGGLVGYSGGYTGSIRTYAPPTGGTQTSGGLRDTNNSAENGAFGKGGNGELTYGGGGGGGGYYGGGGGSNTAHVSSGGGGSSYISGHAGCIAIGQTGPGTYRTGCTVTSTSVECSIHYSEYSFSNTKIIDGQGFEWTTEKASVAGTMTSPSGETEVGHQGNGHARITYLGMY